VGNANGGRNRVSVRKGGEEIKGGNVFFTCSLSPPPSKRRTARKRGRKAGAVCIALIRCSEHGAKQKVCFAINRSSPSFLESIGTSAQNPAQRYILYRSSTAREL